MTGFRKRSTGSNVSEVPAGMGKKRLPNMEKSTSTRPINLVKEPTALN